MANPLDEARRLIYESRQRSGLSTEGYPYPTSQNPSGYSTSPIVTRVDFEGGTNATTSSTTPSTTPPSTSNNSEEEKRRIMEQSRQDNQKKKEEEEAKRKQEQQKAAELASAVRGATYEDKKTAQELTTKAFDGMPDATTNPNAKRVSPPSYEQKQFEIARNLLFNAAQERRRSL